MICPLCKHENQSFLFEKNAQKYVKCSCGLVFINPQPSDADLQSIYERGYYDDWGVESDYKASKIKNFQNIFSGISSVLRSGDKVLDVGCGTGIFLELLKSKGFEPYGVELSKDGYAASVEKIGKEHVFNGYFEDYCNERAFSCIFMCDFLEHVRDPAAVLTQAKSLLDKNSPNATIVIHVPNVNSLLARILKKRWEFFSVDHLFYFSEKTITQLLANAGFAVEKICRGYKYISLEYMRNIVEKRMHGGPLSLISPALSFVPENLRNIPLKLYYGEMTVYANLTR